MKVVFMGLGGIGQRHLRIFRDLYEEAEIYAIRVKGSAYEIDNNLELQKTNIYEKYRIVEIKNYQELSDLRPDIAFVTNPTSLHVPSARVMVENCIPCFIEKPISHNSEGVNDLLKLSKKNSTEVMVGFMMRFHPQAQKIKEVISKRQIGRIYNVTVNINSYMPSWHSYESYKKLYASRRDLGGGVILTESHEIDLLHWFFGKPQSLTSIGGRYSKLDMDVEDNVTILFEQSYMDQIFPVTIQASFVQKKSIRRLLILGEQGTVDWDIASNSLKVESENERYSIEDNIIRYDRNSLFAAQIAHMLDCLKNNKEPLNSLSNTLSTHETIMSILRNLNSKEYTLT